MSEFEDKSVIVTGSNSGIGESTAILFSSRGANVTVCGRDEVRVQQVVEKCRKAGAGAGYSTKVIGVAGDITSCHVREETIRKTMEAFGKLDILVASHGKFMMLPDLDSLSEEMFDDIFNVNVKSVLFLVKAAVPHLKQTQGCVVMTSSVATTLASIGNTAYDMSKAALENMVRSMALEYGPKGIRVNATKPTIVQTRLYRDVPGDMFAPDSAGEFLSRSHPLHGRASDAEEQAHVIAFLASQAAKFVTGVCLNVDGGICIKGMPINFFGPSPAPTAEESQSQK